MTAYLVKLVRDKVGEKLIGTTVEYRKIDNHDEYIDALRKKLIEECAEYLLDPSVDELADILEALFALADQDMNVSWETVIATAQEKRDNRGGFEMGVGMYCETTTGHGLA